MLRDPETNYRDDHLWDEDTEDGLRPEKEYYCKHHSTRKFLEQTRQECLEAGTDTSDIDKALAKLDRVAPSAELLVPAKKLISVLPPKQGRGPRSHKEIIIDTETQDQRAKEYEERQQKLKEEDRIKREEEDVVIMDESDEHEADIVDSIENSSPACNRSQRKRTHSKMDRFEGEKKEATRQTGEDVDTSSSDSDTGTTAHKRLRRLGSVNHPTAKRMKLNVSSSSSSSSAPVLASSHPLLSSYHERHRPSTRVLLRSHDGTVDPAASGAST